MAVLREEKDEEVVDTKFHATIGGAQDTWRQRGYMHVKALVDTAADTLAETKAVILAITLG